MARILPSKSAKRRPIATFALVFLVIIYISISSDGLNSFNFLKMTEMSELQSLMTSRVCGSPAVDGYAHIKPECLHASKTAQWWEKVKPDPFTDLVAHIEHNADYDGVAVAWGINNKKRNVEECARACREHKPNPEDTGFGSLPCNAFVFCADTVCFEPDAHKHTEGDCWLKFTEGPASPEVNMRGNITGDQKERHPTAPETVQWHAGVLLPRNVKLTNGTWSPRYYW